MATALAHLSSPALLESSRTVKAAPTVPVAASFRPARFNGLVRPGRAFPNSPTCPALPTFKRSSTINAKGARTPVVAGVNSRVKVSLITYKGWKDCVEIVNDDCGMVVVPSIGRVMYYGWHGENIFWDEPALHGVTLKPEDKFTDWGSWRNFGGDKVWPNDQSDFKPLMGREGPPDEYFDGGACEVALTSSGCITTSKVSPYNGARIIREFSMAPKGTSVTIRQTLQYVTDKGHGKPFTIWNISQTRATEQVLFPLNPHSKFPLKYKVWDDVAKKNMSVDTETGLGVFLTDSKSMQKVGADSDRWIAGIVGDTAMVQYFRRDSTFTFPDEGCSAECCTFPNYTELEVLSPLLSLEPGSQMTFSIEWELYRLNASGPTAKRFAALEAIQNKLYR